MGIKGIMETSSSSPHQAAPGTPQGRQEGSSRRNRSIGHVISCDGTRARIVTVAGSNNESEDYWAVGQQLSIQVGPNRVVGLLYQVEVDKDDWEGEEQNSIMLSVELAGEVRTNDKGQKYFSSGISSYPYMGAVAHRIRKEDLTAIYRSSDPSAVTIGSLSQSRDVPALMSVDALLARHFSIVGTTGTGKSTAVSLLLHLIIEKRPTQRILILDPHNEYTSAFGSKAHTITANDLDLPFWLLELEEFAQVIFRGRDENSEEIDALREFIPKAKILYREGKNQTLRRQQTTQTGITADTPMPYRLADLLGLLDDEIGSLDGAIRRLSLRRLKSRLEAAINDPRFGFIFGSHNATDRMDKVLGNIYRIPIQGKPITVFQMSGIPSEVVNSIASVLCRLAFDLALASESRVKTLVVCEEAHRYIPADIDSAFAPTRAAIARIAKEGRKYGVSLAVITQRPHELDSTILSQCNTIMAMRLGNDEDQHVMSKAISNASRSSLAFLSSLADRECIAFGRAVPTPMRMIFRTLAASARPTSQHVHEDARQDGSETVEITNIVKAMRGNIRGTEEEPIDDMDWVVKDDDTTFDAPVIETAPPETKRALSLLRRKA
jgi:hypothetical protein